MSLRACRPRSPISAEEATRIRHQVHALQQAQRVARADGEITRAEHAQLTHKAQQGRRMIHVVKTN